MQCQWISEIKNNNTAFNTNTGVAKIFQWGGGGDKATERREGVGGGVILPR